MKKSTDKASNKPEPRIHQSKGPLSDEECAGIAYQMQKLFRKHKMWVDTCIYFNGKALSTCDGNRENPVFSYNGEPFVLENVYPKDFHNYAEEPHIVTIAHEGTGPAYDSFCAYREDLAYPFTDAYDRFNYIISKYDGLVYDFPNSSTIVIYRRSDPGSTTYLSEDFMEARRAWILGEQEEIPFDHSRIDRQLFINNQDIKSIVIPEGVTHIGNAAFFLCRNLADISIPDSVQVIETLAFHETAWYENQPDGVVYAGKVAYEYKGKMPPNASIVLRDGTTGIADEAFKSYDGEENFVSLTIPDSVVYIGDEQFKNEARDFRRNITIRCHENSYAHTYAKDNKFKFQLL